MLQPQTLKNPLHMKGRLMPKGTLCIWMRSKGHNKMLVCELEWGQRDGNYGKAMLCVFPGFSWFCLAHHWCWTGTGVTSVEKCDPLGHDSCSLFSPQCSCLELPVGPLCQNFKPLWQLLATESSSCAWIIEDHHMCDPTEHELCSRCLLLSFDRNLSPDCIDLVLWCIMWRCFHVVSYWPVLR